MAALSGIRHLCFNPLEDTNNFLIRSINYHIHISMVVKNCFHAKNDKCPYHYYIPVRGRVYYWYICGRVV